MAAAEPSVITIALTVHKSPLHPFKDSKSQNFRRLIRQRSNIIKWPVQGYIREFSWTEKSASFQPTCSPALIITVRISAVIS